MTGNAKIQLMLELKNKMTAGLSQAKAKLNGSVTEMKAKLASLKTSHIETFKTMGDEVPGFGRAMSLLGNPYALITAGLVALSIAGADAFKFSEKWEKSMAKVNVTAQLSKKGLSKLSDELLNTGSNSVVPLEGIPDAFNRIISAGLNVNQSIEALGPTLKAAKAGFADVKITAAELETTAAAGISVMKSSGENINKVYDTLFATLNKGNAEFSDIAQYLPKIIPASRNLGFALGEAAGAFAYLTAQGQTAERSTTLLENAFKTLADPDKVKNFKKMGVNIFDKGKIRPLVNIIDDLGLSLTGLSDEQRIKKLSSLGLDMEAAGAFSAMVQNAKELRSTIDFTVNSTGQLAQAYDNAKTGMDNWALITNKFKASVWKPFGDAVRNVVEMMGAAIMWLMNWAKENESWLKKALIPLKAMLSVILFLASPLLKLITLIANLRKNTEGWAQSWEAIKTILSLSWEQITSDFTFLKDSVIYNIEVMWLKFKSFGQYIGALFSNIGEAISLAWTGDFSKAKLALAKDIKTQASVEIEALKAEREKAKNNYFAQRDANFKKISEAKMQIGIRRSNEVEDNGLMEPMPDGTAGGGASPVVPAPTNDGSENINNVVGAARQIKNITINIESFNKGGINTQNTTLQQMNEKDIEKWFNEMMFRVVRNIETSYS